MTSAVSARQPQHSLSVRCGDNGAEVSIIAPSATMLRILAVNLLPANSINAGTSTGTRARALRSEYKETAVAIP